jgi:hypothetical protein
MTRVEGEPSPVQINLEPCAEIHRRRIGGDADIAEIAGAVTRGDIHAPAQCHSKMREVATDANALFVAFRRGSIATRVLIAEANSVMGVVANCLHPLPPRGHAAKQRPGKIRQFLGVAIATAQQIDQHVIRQLTYFDLSRVRRYLIGKAAIRNQKLVSDLEQSGWSHDPRAGIAEHVDIVARRDVRGKLNSVFAQQIAHPRRLNAEHQDHRGFLKALKGDVKSGTNFHLVSP